MAGRIRFVVDESMAQYDPALVSSLTKPGGGGGGGGDGDDDSFDVVHRAKRVSRACLSCKQRKVS